MPVKVTVKNGGMASGILRATARAAIAVVLAVIALGTYLLLR